MIWEASICNLLLCNMSALCPQLVVNAGTAKPDFNSSSPSHNDVLEQMPGGFVVQASDLYMLPPLIGSLYHVLPEQRREMSNQSYKSPHRSKHLVGIPWATMRQVSSNFLKCFMRTFIGCQL